MKLQLVLLAIGLITACLPSGKMDKWWGFGTEEKEFEGLELEMSLVNHPHHQLFRNGGH